MNGSADDWYREALQAATAGDSRAFGRAFALVPRKFDAKAGERERRLSVEYRSDLLLAYLDSSASDALEVVEGLFRTASVDEAELMYRSLPRFPNPAAWVGRCMEGVRSNVLPIFHAVAIGNPFPRDHLGEGDWNQLILKAAFLGEPLAEIDGLETRANRDLGLMLADYISEREAAGRPIADDVRVHAKYCSDL